MRLALGLQSHARRHTDRGRGLVRLAATAEEAGFDGVVIGDHVVIGPRLDRYPYPPPHFTADAPWLEPLTVLAAVAAVTSRITLATGILVAPLRPAVLLAKTAATVDALSDGRLELGVGVGWQPEEFAAVHTSFDRRGELLTDGMAACRTLWADGPASFDAGTVSFADLWCEPRPAHRIPVLFSGGLHPRNVERITRLGDGWVTHPGEELATISAGTKLLRSRYEDAGRDPADLRTRTRLPVERGADGSADVVASLARVESYAQAGVTDLTVWIRIFGAAWRARSALAEGR